MAFLLVPFMPSVSAAQVRTALQDDGDTPASLLDREAGLVVRDVTLEEALTRLTETSGVIVVFSPSLLRAGARTVTCDCERRSVGDALDRILAGTYFEYTVMDGQIAVTREITESIPLVPAKLAPVTFASLSSGAPARGSAAVTRTRATVTGRVTDASTGGPLSGVSVSVVGTELGTITNEAGHYTFTRVPEGTHDLRAQRIGYSTRTAMIEVGAADETITLDFALDPEALLLEAVVAVGYGTQQRRDVTGAVSSVIQERLEDLPNTNVAQVLQGSAPGINIATVSTGAEPSYNIMIRGQNSITANNDPLIVVDGIPYNGDLAEINQSDIASVDVLKDASSTAIYGARGANGVVLITTKKGRVGAPRFNYEGYIGMQEATSLPRLMTGEEFGAWKCDFLLPLPCDEALTPTEQNMLASGQYTDWYDLVLRTGNQQQHNLSLSGGSEDTRFYLSAAALNVEGIALNDEFARYTVRANLDQSVGSSIDAGLSTQLSYADRSGRQAGVGGAFRANPLMPAFDEEGEMLLTPWPEDPIRQNPLQDLNIIDDNISRRTLASGYLEARFPFLEGLSYRLNGGIDFLSHDVASYWGRNTRNGLTSQGVAQTQARRNFDWTVENLIRYQREFGNHSFDLTALYGTQAFSSQVNSLRAVGFPNDVLTYHQADVARSLSPSDNVVESGLVSQMGRLNYGYDGRYLITLTARRDGFSGFGDNYKYGVFPSVAVAWNASEEAFWDVEHINTLKVRLSYGQNGNSAIQPYQTLARLEEFTTYDEGSWPGFKPATLGNPNLRWETTTSLNFGIDFGALGDRVRGSVDLYNADTHDLLLERLISPTHGISRLTENIGEVRNRGIELALSVTPLETATFSWTADFNIAANRNQILELYGDGKDDLANQWFIGQSINTHFGWAFDGVWQEGDDIANSAQPDAQPGDARVKDINGDGKIDVDDRTFLGTTDPSYTGGLLNTLRFGNLSLSAFIHTVQGVTLYDYEFLGWPEDARSNALYFEWWTPENPINTRWANRQSANPLEVGLRRDASFIRLKDVTLSYDLPATLSTWLGAESLRVYASGRNLWTHTDWPLLDPEIVPRPGDARPPPPGAPLAQINDAPSQRTIPMERILSIGVNASF